jgi:3-dehydroquinate synthase
LVDTTYLTTVTDREIKSGTAEIIKYGITYDVKLFNQIKNNKDLNISDLIFRSVEIKNEVVLKDPKEKNIRKILNFGHTLGHAIESFYLESEEKENLTHGEAIAIGMVCESYMSSKLLEFPIEKVNEVKEVVLSIYNRTNLLKEDFSSIMELLKHDKKNVNGQVNFVLLNDYEDFKLDCKVSEELIIESMEFYNS